MTARTIRIAETIAFNATWYPMDAPDNFSDPTTPICDGYLMPPKKIGDGWALQWFGGPVERYTTLHVLLDTVPRDTEALTIGDETATEDGCYVVLVSDLLAAIGED